MGLETQGGTRFCGRCGAPLALRVPAGDDRERHVCTACGAVHYRNPKIVVGCIAHWRGRVLLCRRAIEPRRGLWTVPAGFLEHGESAEAGAARETLEEAGARVGIDALHGIWSLPAIGQVYLLFRGRMRDARVAAGAESLEAGLFAEEAVPWQAMAFPVVTQALRAWFEDRRRGRYRLHRGLVEATRWS
ncbi:NUDIX hydrolase [Inmirania thermothiophila]|uniref:ADP-ribose pyrophosphatase YjhB (NUDIX family) n=1 Tax=Inmirania thermothiophila TaxID=1750597 RepID=A0A3N1Y1S6_9GAMM|nr:NUDIX hydrolase [Inmirania thermothiophila]ROR32770.1 ADP-ribose pyrophosphatase YjhB (NUDIX family) [Inmirania thermothiophila]